MGASTEPGVLDHVPQGAPPPPQHRALLVSETLPNKQASVPASLVLCSSPSARPPPSGPVSGLGTARQGRGG